LTLSLQIVLIFLVFFAAIDLFISHREMRAQLPLQWITNIGLFVVGQLAQLALPLNIFAAATLSSNFSGGILPALNLTGPIISIFAWGLASSLVSYLFHVASHKFHWLWAFHRIHHCDELLNSTTGLRHHPIETLYSIPVYGLLAFLLAPPPEATLIWYSFAIAIDFFSHSKINLPKRLGSMLEHVIVTPSLHRVHHSAKSLETDSNYGNTFTFWDRIFGTFQRAEPTKIGLDSPTLSGPASRDFDTLLTEPFRFIFKK
jgi:sterol desaturase/sphingolipid hydroxylase (fatty acid hydroxylase superfamily)